MATVGNAVAPSSFQEWFGLNSVNHVARLITMPEAGTITAVTVFAAGKDSSVGARTAIWSPGGGVLSYSGLFTMSGAGFALGVGAWYSGGVSYHAAAGEQLYIGWARNPNGACQWPYTGSSSHYHSTSSSWPTTLAGGTHGGDIGAYATYTPDGGGGGGGGSPGVYVRRGGAWVQADGAWVRRGGVWVKAGVGAVVVRRGGVWVPA